VLTAADLRLALGGELVAELAGDSDCFTAVQNDSRRAAAGELFVALQTEVRDGHDFVADAVARGATGVVVQRDVAVPSGVCVFKVRNTTHAIGEIAAFWRRRFRARCVAIAGNVGKTTTKELTAAVLGSRYNVLKSPANFNDEIGLAMTLFMLNESHERIVVEVGMFELGEIRRLCEIAQPQTAIVLNVGPTHLERLGSMDAIAAAKAEAVEALDADGTALLNVDDARVAAMASKTRARVVRFGLSEAADLRASDIESRGLEGTAFRVTYGGETLTARCPLPGRALVSNALAAIGAGIAEGMSLAEAVDALATAQVPSRLQVRRLPNGVTVLDDAYNAGPASVLAALDVLAETPGRKLALLGDMLELGSEEEAGHRTVGLRAAAVVDELFTVGRRAEVIAVAAREAGAKVTHFASKEDATRALKAALRGGDVLLIKASHGMALDSVATELAG
jgi:UDP-N-acetylmuramoyl-tripeptide--D-alanyl-D-alanine ligase